MIPSAALRYWRLNDPFCSERRSDGAAAAAAKIDNAVQWPGQPLKIAASFCEICTPSSTWFLRLNQVFNGILIVSAVFAQLTVECPITLQ